MAPPANNKAMKRQTLTRLQQGDVIELSGEPWIVWSANECRANACPVQFARLEYQPNGRLIERSGKSEGISPNSEAPILLCVEGDLVEFVARMKKGNINSMKTKKTNKKEKAPKSKRVSKYGLIRGHSAPAFIRACGHAGWTLDEVRQFVADEAETEIKPTTVRSQWWWGARQGNSLPDLSKSQLEELRPKGLRKNGKKKPAKPEEPARKKKKKELKEKPSEEPLAEEEYEPVADETTQREEPAPRKKKKKKTRQEEPESQEEPPTKKKKKKKLPIYEEEAEELAYEYEEDGLPAD